MTEPQAAAQRRPAASRFSSIVRWSAVLLCAAGWWVSIDLLRLSGGESATNPLLQATCEAGNDANGFDCLSVLASRLRVHAVPERQRGLPGIPWAAVGAGYFACIGLWYLFAGVPTRGRTLWHLFIALIVAWGAYHSGMFLYVMAFVLKRWCIGCLSVHAINALLLLLTLIAFPWRRGDPSVRRPTHALAAAALCAGLLAFGLHVTTAQLFTQAGVAKRYQSEYLKVLGAGGYARWRYEQEPLRELPAAPEAAERGAVAHTIVVFSDFQCPRCRQISSLLHRLGDRHPGVFRVEYRHYPLHHSCNAEYKLPRGGHPLACDAARAVEAARLVGGGEAAERMRRLLYARQEELNSSELVAYAAETGLDAAAFAGALGDARVSGQVAKDVALAAKLGVRDVPFVLLDGRRLEFWTSEAVWEELLGVKPTASSAPAPVPK